MVSWRPKNSFWAAVADKLVVLAACWAGAKAAAEPTRARASTDFMVN